jgi:hypothetical protein
MQFRTKDNLEGEYKGQFLRIVGSLHRCIEGRNREPKVENRNLNRK